MKHRPATMDDAHFIYDIRTDDLSIKNSINQAKFEYELHEKWMMRNLKTIPMR